MSAIAPAGMVLSQPTSATTASNMWPRPTSSIESAIPSRLTSDAFMPSVPMVTPSEMAMVLNSMGVPPAARTPSFIFAARRRRWKLQGMVSIQVLAMPTMGRARSSSVNPMALSMARAPERVGPSRIVRLGSWAAMTPPLNGTLFRGGLSDVLKLAQNRDKDQNRESKEQCTPHLDNHQTQPYPAFGWRFWMGFLHPAYHCRWTKQQPDPRPNQETHHQEWPLIRFRPLFYSRKGHVMAHHHPWYRYKSQDGWDKVNGSVRYPLRQLHAQGFRGWTEKKRQDETGLEAVYTLNHQTSCHDQDSANYKYRARVGRHGLIQPLRPPNHKSRSFSKEQCNTIRAASVYPSADRTTSKRSCAACAIQIARNVHKGVKKSWQGVDARD